MASPAIKETASLADFLQLLRVRRALVALILASSVIVTMAVTAFLPNWYLATTKVSVQKPESDVKMFSAQSADFYDPYFIQTQYKIMQSEKILYPVIQNLGLNSKIGAMLGSQAPLTPALTYRYIIDKMLVVESQRSSSIIEINVYAQDPLLAAAMANEVARVYSADRILEATSAQRSGLAEAEKKVEEMQKTVGAQSDAVEKLRRELNITGVDTTTRTTDADVDRIRQMRTTLDTLETDASRRKETYEGFKNTPAERRFALVNSEMIPDQNIQNLLTAYIVADQKVLSLRAQNLGDEHPEIRAAVSTRDSAKRNLETMLTGFEESLRIGYNTAEAGVRTLREKIAALEKAQILSAGGPMRRFNDAQKELKKQDDLLTAFTYNLGKLKIEFEAPKRTIEILNTAEPARRPSKPNWALNFIFSIFFGTVMGVGVAVALEYFDTSFRNVADVESRLGLAVLGVIPFTKDGPDADTADPAESEPYRVLQTNLNLAQRAGKSSSLVIFSAGPGEGKSTTLYQLARMMAASGEKVLLIDSDLRRPTQHKIAGRPREPGLAELLQGKAGADAVIQKGIAPNLDFIPSGGVAGFTLGLLHQNRLRELIAGFKNDYARVVFDSPPIIGVSDATVLASVIDGAVLLIQHRRNPASMVLRAHQLLTGLKTPMLGVVLNQVPQGGGEDYDYYTSNYSYYGESSGKRTRKTEAGGRKTDSGGDKLELG